MMIGVRQIQGEAHILATLGQSAFSSSRHGICGFTAGYRECSQIRPQPQQVGGGGVGLVVWRLLIRDTGEVHLLPNLLPLGGSTVLLGEESADGPHVHHLQRPLEHTTMHLRDKSVTWHLLNREVELVALVECLLKASERVRRQQLLLVELEGRRGNLLGAVGFGNGRPCMFQAGSLDALIGQLVLNRRDDLSHEVRLIAGKETELREGANAHC